MTSFRRRALDFWLQEWKQRLKKPAELVTADNLANLFAVLYRELTERKKPFDPSKLQVGYKGHLVARIRTHIIDGPGPTIRFLTSEIPTEWAIFSREISKTPIDPPTLLPVLSKILEVCQSPRAVTKMLANELLVFDGEEISAIRVYTDLLLQGLLLSDEASALAGVPAEILSQFGLEAALAPYLSEFVEAPEPFKRARVECSNAWRIAQAHDWMEFLPRFKPNTDEGYSGYPVVHGLAKRAQELISGNRTPTEAEKELLGRAALTHWARQTLNGALVRLGISVRTFGSGPDAGSLEARYCSVIREIADEILLPWVISLPTTGSWHHHPPFSDLRAVVTAGTEAFMRRSLVQECISVFEGAIPLEQATGLGEELWKTMTEEENYLREQFVPETSHYWTARFRAWAARADVQQRIGASSDTLDPLVCTCVQEACTRLNSAKMLSRTDYDAMCKNWLTAVLESTHHCADSWRGINWEALPPRVIQHALTQIAVEYEAETEYDTIFTVEGIDAQNQKWNANAIMWYAEPLMSFGEDIFHRNRARWPDTAQLNAWIVVHAKSMGAARVRGRLILEGALDALTFALSVTEHASGLKPKIARDTLIGSVERGSSTGGGGRKREDLSDVMTARDHDLIRFSKVYGRLSGLTEGGASTELEHRLLRALAWYREGRWESNDTTRFLKYFIAFEQIFVAGLRGQKFKMPELASEIARSWVNTVGVEGPLLHQQIERARQSRQFASDDLRLSAFLDQNSPLIGWREDIRPWFMLPALSSVLSAIRTDSGLSTEIKKTFQEYVDNLTTFVNWMEGSEDRRADEREQWILRMHILSERRHIVAHEGFMRGPDAALYAHSLESALEDVLMKLSDLVLNLSQEVSTVDDALKWHKTPWTT